MAQYASYMAGTQYNPADMMQREDDWVNPGVISLSDLIITPGSGLTVSVSGSILGGIGGNAWLPMGYRFYNDAAQVVALATSNATNPRIDLIVAAVDTAQSPYVATIKAITGTPAASPVAPSIPGTLIGIVLGQVAVAANATTISAGNITDLRVVSSLKGVPSQTDFNAHLADSTYQVATGTATAITITTGTLVNGYAKTFIAGFTDSASAKTINGKPFYKPGTTTSPGTIAGKAYTVWYDTASGGRFFIKASAEGTAVVANVLAGTTFSNDTDTGLAGTMPDRTFATNGAGAYQITTNKKADGIGSLTVQPLPGYYNGVANASGYGEVLVAEPNLLVANILSGMSMFGLVGTGTNAKRTASGIATTSGSMLTISGLTFTPKHITIIPTLISNWSANGITYDANATTNYFKDGSVVTLVTTNSGHINATGFSLYCAWGGANNLSWFASE